MECFLASEVYIAGKVALILVKTIDSDTSLFNATVFAQAHGHINADLRWFKSTTKMNDLFLQLQQQSTNMIEKYHAPRADPLSSSNSATSCIFATTRIPISPSHLTSENGSFLEFFLPIDIIPSFRGLCVNINYYLSIEIQQPLFTKFIHFPFTVVGKGINANQYLMRYYNQFIFIFVFP
jgi:hypothetical protein